MTDTLIRGTFVSLPSCGEVEILVDHLLAVDETGHIVHFSEADSESSIARLNALQAAAGASRLIKIANGSFLVAPFCDLHLHAPQFLYQGTGLHLPLMKWLDEYAFKAEEKLDADPVLARKVYTRLAERLIENGTGTVLLFGTIKAETNLIMAEIMQMAGIRAFVGKLSMDISSRPTYVEPSADSALSAASSFVARCRAMMKSLPTHHRLIEPVLTPRFVPTCSDDLLGGLGRLAKEESLIVQSHMAEAHDQIEWVRHQRGAEDIAVFDRHGLLSPNTIQAHCTFLRPEDISRLASSGTAIAHCPLSNAYFSAAPFALRETLDAGVCVGLGTDVAGGYSLDMMNAMRQAVIVSRMREGTRQLGSREAKDAGERVAIGWKESLYLATQGGMNALGVGHATGMFKVGSIFDAQQIKVLHVENECAVGALDFLEYDLEVRKSTTITIEMVEKWWCLGDQRNRETLWVCGKIITTPVAGKHLPIFFPTLNRFAQPPLSQLEHAHKACSCSFIFLLAAMRGERAEPKNLHEFVIIKRALSSDARGSPWLDDGNILLVTHNRAYKSSRGLLVAKAKAFVKIIADMNDGSVDVIEGCPVILLNDSDHDLSCFLHALHEDMEPYFPFESLEDFYTLAGTLRLATKYRAEAVRASAIATLEKLYPTTLTGWDYIRGNRGLSWECDRILIINLAREVKVFSVLPSAMAMLTNDSSAGEVFGVPIVPRDQDIVQRPPHEGLNSIDKGAFALMKEFNYYSIVVMLKFIRSVGVGCTRPPEVTPVIRGRAPVGSSSLRQQPSACKETFKEIAAGLLELLVLENPAGYAEFVGSVNFVKQDRTKMCKVCWKGFRDGYAGLRKQWWDHLPRVLNFSGWDDDLLQPIEM